MTRQQIKTIACLKCFDRASIDPEKMNPYLGLIPNELNPNTFAYKECEKCFGSGKIYVNIDKI